MGLGRGKRLLLLSYPSPCRKITELQPVATTAQGLLKGFGLSRLTTYKTVHKGQLNRQGVIISCTAIVGEGD